MRTSRCAAMVAVATVSALVLGSAAKLVDWVAALIAGEPLDDVHCTDCELA
jgi:hypothetical protein